MANKLKKSTPKADAEKPAKTEKAGRSPKTSSDKFRSDREENLDFRTLAKDERTWKIIGTISLLISIFLFIAFISYLFTWREDQSQARKGIEFLFEDNDDNKVSNLLGRLGAFTSHNLIYNGFGLASFLFCTFFFVIGINLLFNRRVFSIWRNLKYVTFGLMIASISLAFLFPGVANSFPWGGEVGNMISSWLVNFLGTIGTACLLLVVAGSYLIWQFNPSFNLPQGRAANVGDEAEMEDEVAVSNNATSVNEMYADQKGNSLKADGAMVVNTHNEENENTLTLTEREQEEQLSSNDPII